MVNITVVGGTGYAGSAIVREAVERGHHVTSFSRTAPEGGAAVAGVIYETGSVLDAVVRDRAVSGSAVVVSTLSPHGELDGRIVEADRALAALAGIHGVRFGVVGGVGSLRVEPGGPRMADTDQLPAELVGVAKQMNQVLLDLIDTPAGIDWFFVSPAVQFGASVPGEALGVHRVGGDVALFDSAGVSAISGADFASAVVDEIENPAHHRQLFSVAY